MLLSYFFGRKYYAVPYNLKKIGGYLGLAVGFSALAFYVFERNMLIGTALLLVFLLLTFISEKNDLKRILKR
jgi:hypothetical protein